jgi:hypothetical protein
MDVGRFLMRTLDVSYSLSYPNSYYKNCILDITMRYYLDMKIIKFSVYFFLLLSPFLGGVTLAKTSPFYSGISYGSAKVIGPELITTTLEPNSKLSKSSTSYSLTLGYTLNERWSLELDYNDTQEVTDTFDIKSDIVFTGTTVIETPYQKVRIQSFILAPMFSYPISKNFWITYKLGYGFNRVQEEYYGGAYDINLGKNAAIHTYDADWLSYSYRLIGIKAALTENILAHIYWDITGTADYRVNRLMGQISYSF